MSEVKKFSFGRSAGTPVAPPADAATPPPAAPQANNTATAVTPMPEGSAHPAQNAAQLPPRDLPVPQKNYEPPAFFQGGEDEAPDAQDVKFPRLNIVQKSSGAELLKHGFGSLVLKGTIKLPLPARIVVAGMRPKIWIEKTKFGTQGKIARSIDEVVQLGGTEKWTYSKENAKSGSQKPWFMPSVTALVLIQRPDSLPEDDFRFEAAGKLYVPALVSVKSTNYDAFFGAIQSEKALGKLRKGYSTHFIDTNVIIKPFSGGESGVFNLSFGESTPPEVQALANSVVGG